MPNAHGSAKQVRYKKESQWGVAPGATGAQLLRRVTHVPNLKKTTAESDEIASHRQRTGLRHGMKSGEIAYAGHLSPGTFKDFLAAAVRRAFAAVTPIATLSITVAGTGPTYTLTRSAGSWLTDGVKIGQIGRLTAGTFNAANLNKNLCPIAITATVLTVIPLNGVALVAEGPITGATWTPTGKVTFAPGSGHTDDSFAFEDWHPDTSQSELYLGAKLNELAISQPTDGLIDVSMNFLAKDMTPNTSQYFTSPTVETTSELCHSVDGVIVAQSGELAIVTGLSINLKANMVADGASGANTYQGINPGKILVDGQLTAYFPDASLRDYFLNETQVTLVATYANGSAAGADFVGFSCPFMKFTGADKDDGDKSVIRTLPFQSAYNGTGGAGQATEQTSLYVQDSLA